MAVLSPDRVAKIDITFPAIVTSKPNSLVSKPMPTTDLVIIIRNVAQHADSHKRSDTFMRVQKLCPPMSL
jgi:hypothetical protein